MTPQPQQEYIITEEHLTDIELRLGAFWASPMIRSRPAHPAAPTDEQCKICSSTIRNQTLDELKKFKGRYVEDAVDEYRRFHE